mmetsp:Transcript_17980/g.13003  ORF Transcript_17980/g.13003 Transcript_17980/m.13003 type:complete len:91 (+) Transcript_17980:574-846(+)
MYSARLKIPAKELEEKFWGDNFYDVSQKRWLKTNEGSDGKVLQRGFVQFVMDPIIKLIQNIMDDKKEAVLKMLANLDIQLSEEEQKLTQK